MTYFSLLLLLCTATIVAEHSDPTAQSPQEPVQPVQKIIVQQTIIQTVVNQKASITPAQPPLFGKKLRAYLNAADNETSKKMFLALPLRAKIMYMLKMNIEQYQRFLERYTDEEWSILWHNAERKEQEHLPRTRTEQLILIRDAYYAWLVKHSSFLFSYFNPKAPYPSDIKTFQQKCYVDQFSGTRPYDMQYFMGKAKKEFLKAYMLRKRCELFNL